MCKWWGLLGCLDCVGVMIDKRNGGMKVAFQTGTFFWEHFIQHS